MAKVKVTLSVEEGLRNRVAMLAAVEERNFSQMWGVLVGEALADREPSPKIPKKSPNLPPVFPRSLEQEPDSSGVFPSVPVSGAKKLRVRTGRCIHRNPPEAFCRYCDGGA